jgi:hypothetical protein
MGLLFDTITWWLISEQWPTAFVSIPHFQVNAALALDGKVLVLLCNLVFLYALTLSGIARTLSDAAHLTLSDGSVPRINWLFIMCGVSTICSGYFSGPPILISPESAPGIKSGARTGLSMLVCGILFSISVLFCPLLEHVPPAGTSPLLILVGLTLFVNSSRIKWTAPDEAVPAFFVLLLIPFTYSILTGVGVGYAFYVVIGLFTGQLQRKFHRAFFTFPDDLPVSVSSTHYLPFGEPDSLESFEEEVLCSCEDEPHSPLPEPPRPALSRRPSAQSLDAKNAVRILLPVVPSTRTRKRSVSFSEILSADNENNV